MLRQHSAAHSLLSRWKALYGGVWYNKVRPQNNDCLFVVVLLAVIIAPPPLTDASRSRPHTRAHTYTPTGMRPRSGRHEAAKACEWHVNEYASIHGRLIADHDGNIAN